MSVSWYFYSFNPHDLENKILKGQGIYTTEENVNNRHPDVIEKLRIAAFDYNRLEKQYWTYLDQYLTNSIIGLADTEQVSPDHAHWRVWSELANLNNAEPKMIFNALSGEGRRYNFISKRKSFFSKLLSAREVLTGKNTPDYIIIKDDELGLFINSLNKIFEYEDELVFKKYGGKEELIPCFLDPFIIAKRKGKAVLGMLT